MTRIIGIDLGTTNTCAAFVSNKVPRIVPVEGGFNTMPSVVTFLADGSVTVGQGAREQLQVGRERLLYGVKRLLGRQFNSPTVTDLRRYYAYEIVPGENGEAAVKIGDKIHSCTEIQSKILSQIRRYAEIHLGEEIPDVVIAVPAYYSDHQRSLVKQAGKLAGWTVRRVVNEPTAAALAYGFNRGFNQKILVYDLGGGTFDVSVLEITGNVFQVVATGGDLFLGGTDFDNRILAWLIDQFRRQTKIDLLDEVVSLPRLRDAAERAKIELSLLANTQVRLPGVVERRGKRVDFEMVLDRDTLNDLTRELVQRTTEVVTVLLKDKCIDKNEIDEIIMVGGQTRMPLVVEMISQYFGKIPRKGVNPDECVALGAALLGDSLAQIDAVTLLDTLSVPIGIADATGGFQVVIPKHSSLPYTATVTVETTRDNQTEIETEVYQGEPGTVRRAEYLGTLRIADLPKAPAKAQRVPLTFALDSEGMLKVTTVTAAGATTREIQLSTVERPPLPDERVNESAHAAVSASTARLSVRDLVKTLFNRK